VFKLKMIFLLICLTSPFAHAAGGSHLGFNVGFGLPYTSQYGLNYVTASNRFSFSLGYNALNLSVDSTTVSSTGGTVTSSTTTTTLALTKPEFMIKWHPFMGAFFLGVGFGQQTLLVSGKESLTGETAELKVTSTTITPTLGWMWGMTDGGFFGGMDFGSQIPSGVTTTVTTTLPETNQTYIDAKEQGDKFGNASLGLLTLLRIGYLF
jgi:hypothetical protein